MQGLTQIQVIGLIVGLGLICAIINIGVLIGKLIRSRFEAYIKRKNDEVYKRHVYTPSKKASQLSSDFSDFTTWNKYLSQTLKDQNISPWKSQNQ